MKIYKEDEYFCHKLKIAFDNKKVPFELIMAARTVSWENLIKEDDTMIEYNVPSNMINIMNMSTVISQLCDRVAEGTLEDININLDKEIAAMRINTKMLTDSFNIYSKFYNSIIRS